MGEFRPPTVLSIINPVFLISINPFIVARNKTKTKITKRKGTF